MKNSSHKTVPAREVWIFEDKKILPSVKRGLEQARRGKTKSLGSFAKCFDED